MSKGVQKRKKRTEDRRRQMGRKKTYKCGKTDGKRELKGGGEGGRGIDRAGRRRRTVGDPADINGRVYEM